MKRIYKVPQAEINGMVEHSEQLAEIKDMAGQLVAKTREWQDLQNDLAKWSDETFGLVTIYRILGMISHLRREVDELMEKPYDLDEQADCLLLLLDINRSTECDVSKLLEAARKKLEVNKGRKWTKKNVDGSIEHEE